MTTIYNVSMLVQQKLLNAASKSAGQIGIVPETAKFSTTEKDGDFFYYPARQGWVYRFKGTALALTFTVTADPPPDPPPADRWGIVNISTDPTERKNDPATRPLTNDNPPDNNSTKGTPILIKLWEGFVKLINVPKSVAWLLAIGSQWINSGNLPLRAEQLCSSCNIIHIMGENATHYQVETLYNTADVSKLDPNVWDWLHKPWLFHQCLMRNGITGAIYLVGNGKYVYYPLLRTESAPMWIRKEYVEVMPTTLRGKQITAFRFEGASIWGMVDGVEVPLRLNPKRDDEWQDPDWLLITQGAIPPA